MDASVAQKMLDKLVRKENREIKPIWHIPFELTGVLNSGTPKFEEVEVIISWNEWLSSSEQQLKELLEKYGTSIVYELLLIADSVEELYESVWQYVIEDRDPIKIAEVTKLYPGMTFNDLEKCYWKWVYSWEIKNRWFHDYFRGETEKFNFSTFLSYLAEVPTFEQLIKLDFWSFVYHDAWIQRLINYVELFWKASTEEKEFTEMTLISGIDIDAYRREINDSPSYQELLDFAKRPNKDFDQRDIVWTELWFEYDESEYYVMRMKNFRRPDEPRVPYDLAFKRKYLNADLELLEEREKNLWSLPMFTSKRVSSRFKYGWSIYLQQKELVLTDRIIWSTIARTGDDRSSSHKRNDLAEMAFNLVHDDGKSVYNNPAQSCGWLFEGNDHTHFIKIRLPNWEEAYYIDTNWNHRVRVAKMVEMPVIPWRVDSYEHCKTFTWNSVVAEEWQKRIDAWLIKWSIRPKSWRSSWYILEVENMFFDWLHLPLDLLQELVDFTLLYFGPDIHWDAMKRLISVWIQFPSTK